MNLSQLRVSARTSLAEFERSLGRDHPSQVIKAAAPVLEGWMRAVCRIVADSLPAGSDRDRLNTALTVEGHGKPLIDLGLGELVNVWEKARIEDSWKLLDKQVTAPAFAQLKALRHTAIHDRDNLRPLDAYLFVANLRYFAERLVLVLPDENGEAPRLAGESPALPREPARPWRAVDSAFLDSLSLLPGDELVRYFDGADPAFAIGVDPRVPMLPVGQRVLDALRAANGVTIDLLAAPTGEGKSTLLVQLAARLAREPDTRVYWLDPGAGGFDVAATRALVATTGRTVFVIDQLDEHVDGIVGLVRGQREVILGSAASVHIVGASRRYRWEAAAPRIKGIGSACQTRRYDSAGIDLASAQAIVTAWAGQGREGLRKLHDVPEPARAEHLLEAVRARHDSKDGLFGGLLNVRFGPEELRAHLVSLIGDQVRADNQVHLAYLSIACADALAVDGLDERVLCQALGVSEPDFRSQIRPSLRGEAVGPTRGDAGAAWQARHADIARAAVAVAVDTLGAATVGRTIAALVKAAVRHQTALYIPIHDHATLTHVAVWLERRIGEQLGEADVTHDIAVEVARAAWSAEARADYLAVYLSRLRRARRHQEAASVAREHWDPVCGQAPYPDAIRSVAINWALAEEAFHNPTDALWLAMLSLSDQLRRPGVEVPDPLSPLDLKKGLLTLARLASRVGYAQPLSDPLRALDGLDAELPTDGDPDPPESWAPAAPVPRASELAERLALVEGRADDTHLPDGLKALCPLTFNTLRTAYQRNIASRFGPAIPFLPPRDQSHDATALFLAFSEYLASIGFELFPAQAEAVEVLAEGPNLLLNTPTGSGKSMVGLFAHFAALAQGVRSVYTAPTKALVNEKFFWLCNHFGARRVGLATGDATVNHEAPVLVCTAEVLASMALGDPDPSRFDWIVMDEFHYYDDAQRGQAWLLPLLEMRHAHFALLSATVGNAAAQAKTVAAQTGRPTRLVQSDVRPVALEFEYKEQVLRQSLVDIRDNKLCPAYVVSFTKPDAAERAADPIRMVVTEGPRDTDERKLKRAKLLESSRFDTPYGSTLRKLLRDRVGVHHAGLLPRYRLLVERCAQQGLLDFVSGTDTLGVGVNLPIRTVLITQLYKRDNHEVRHLSAREFHQVAGRAGRKGHDDQGTAWVQAPEHEMQNRLDKALGKKKKSPAQPPEGYKGWSRDKFEGLVKESASPLTTRLNVDGALVMRMLSRKGGGVNALRSLIDRAQLTRGETERAHARSRELLAKLGATGRVQPDAHGALRIESIDDGGRSERPLHIWLKHALLADAFDARLPDFALRVLSFVESVLYEPTSVQRAQLRAARSKAKQEAYAARRAGDTEAAEAIQGKIDNDAVTRESPCADEIRVSFEAWRVLNPWYEGPPPEPRFILREMYEGHFGFNDYIHEYRLGYEEGQLLRYLSEAYRVLEVELPGFQYIQNHFELRELRAWLDTLVRSVDASLVHEWERFMLASDVSEIEETAPPRPPQTTLDSPQFRRELRTAAFGWVRAFARLGDSHLENDAAEALAGPGFATESAKDAYRQFRREHQGLIIDANARGPEHFQYEGGRVFQQLVDEEGDLDWVIEGEVDRELSQREGFVVVFVRRIGPA